jgi:pimeloyl-ACP methyl ester carboxylesterase
MKSVFGLVLRGLFAVTLALAILPLSAAADDTLRAASAISADGTQITYSAGGAGEPVIVFVHGWSCDRSYWSEQLPHFATSYRVMAIDLAGHGDSGSTRENYTMANFGADVAAAAAGDFPVVLVGHSMGGPVILEAARLMGNRVLGMVAVDALQNVSVKVRDEVAAEAQLATMAADFQRVARPFIEGMFLDDANVKLRERIISDMLETDERVAISAIRGMQTMDYADVLSELDAPLVLISSTMRPSNIAALQALHGNSRLQNIDGVGHFLMMEKPAVFNAMLQDVITQMAADANGH